MSTPNITSIIEKIQALLNKTTDNGCTEEEAASAAAMAQKLLDKYNLDMAAVNNAAQEQDPLADYGFIQFQYSKDGYNRHWEATLLFTLAPRFHCRGLYSGGPNTGCSYIIGKPHNVEVLVYMYNSLRTQLRILADSMMKTRVDRSISTYAWKRSFINGACWTIGERLDAQRRSAEAAVTALVVRTSDELNKAQEVIFGKVNPAKMMKQLASDEAFRKGLKAGHEVSLNDALKGGAAQDSPLQLTGGMKKTRF